MTTGLGRDLTERQTEYLRGLIDEYCPGEAARRAGYEMPVFESTKVNLYRGGGFQGGDVLGVVTWVLPKTVDDDDDRT